jgi:hypothetical protein
MKIYLSPEHALELTVNKVNDDMYNVVFNTIDVIPTLCSKTQFFLNKQQFLAFANYFKTAGENIDNV